MSTAAETPSPQIPPLETLPPRPLLRNSIARFASDGSGLLLGTIASIITARLLGPSSKGTLAALTFITTLVIQASLMGLGDAVVVRVGQGEDDLQDATSSSLSAVLISSAVGALVVLLYALAQLPLGHRWVWQAVITACVTVGVATSGQFLLYVVYARHQVVTTSLITILTAVVSTVGVVVFCAVLDLDVLGGVLAGLVAAITLLLAAVIVLRGSDLRLRLGLQISYLRPALRFGLRTQLANILAYSSARLDLLLVYALAGLAPAGLYSVALTLGTLTGFVAVALSFASFPRMAQMSEAAALALTTQLARTAAVVGMPFAAIMSVGVWAVIPPLLGSAYAGTAVPAVILLFGNLLWGEQWLLSRALAARGDPVVLFRSFALNLVTMVLVDLVLIPLLGTTGAAIGSVLAPAAGLVICLRAYARRGVPAASLIPRRADLDHWRELIPGRSPDGRAR